MEPDRSDPSVRVVRTYRAYLALGHEVAEGPEGRVVREPRSPRIYDANHLQPRRPDTPEAVEALLGFADRELGGLGHRHVLAGPDTPPALEAVLALRGYAPKPTLQLLLEDGLRGPAPDRFALRPVGTEEDWRAFRELLREDHLEDCARRGRPPYDEGVTDEMVTVKRRKPGLRFWLARVDGHDAGFFSAWAGVDGVGMVEDLFTHPRFRRRGVARALLHRAVEDARAGGAREVLIGADPADTPKDLYARMGFRPVCVTWSWLWTER
ncbi:MAG: GNAT family N-acetyltransferase [Myxococcota bacterium]|nr:GNAT family N-acetyltransferase [Myxococcota bacterium]